jgi:hypothetical protein
MNTPRGAVRWLISCDESGVHGARYYGFGSLWLAWQRRGDFARTLRHLRDKHGYSDELKWQRAKSRVYHQFFLDVVDYFFREPSMAFHCIVVRKGVVRKELHGGDFDLARRKHFTMLLTNKVRRCVQAQPGRDHTFRVWVDPIASRYGKADEVVEIISNRVLAKVLGPGRTVDRVLTKDSKHSPSIQLSDLLLGAVMDAWQDEASSPTKLAVRSHIARYLGWPDLRADTRPSERKFNIWYFHDKTRGPREPETRSVQLLYPLPARRG